MTRRDSDDGSDDTETDRVSGGSDGPTDGWRERPRSVRLYLVGAVFLGVTALFGGGALLLNPTDGGMGLDPAWLDGTPFPDYFVPGLVLFGVLGVGAFVVSYGVYARLWWAWPGAVGLGVALVAWIVTQLVLIRSFHPLHLIYGVLGFLLAGLANASGFRADADGSGGRTLSR